MKLNNDKIRNNSDFFIDFFKALANEERLQIVQLLQLNTEMFAQDIERHFFLEQSTTSHHLNVLRRTGIANTRKEGRKVFYSLNTPFVSEMMEKFSHLFDEPSVIK